MKGKREHANLFWYLSDKQEVYEKFESDQKRDTLRAIICLCGVFASIAAFGSYHNIFIASLGATFGVGFFAIYIDLSNRNFLMHTIDWLEATKNEDRH